MGWGKGGKRTWVYPLLAVGVVEHELGVVRAWVDAEAVAGFDVAGCVEVVTAPAGVGEDSVGGCL